jgi:hypothetical protein
MDNHANHDSELEESESTFPRMQTEDSEGQRQFLQSVARLSYDLN